MQETKMQSRKVALVTGAATGLGHSIAEALLEAGYRVVITDQNLTLAEHATAKWIESGLATEDQLFPLKLDIREGADFKAAIEAVEKHWGALQVVVNNAAMTKATPLLEISADEFSAVTDVNQRGTFLSCQYFGKYLAQKGYGRIINMASLAGQNGGTATGAHYAASKGAIVTLTKIFAKEFAAQGVTVNAISPGPIDSPTVRSVVPEDRLKGIVEQIPVKQLGDMAFIGKVVVLLASPEAYFTTGATWDINGGLFMR